MTIVEYNSTCSHMNNSDKVGRNSWCRDFLKKEKKQKRCSDMWRSRKVTSTGKKLSSKSYLLGNIYSRNSPKSRLWLTTLKFRNSCVLTVQEVLQDLCQTRRPVVAFYLYCLKWSLYWTNTFSMTPIRRSNMF